MLCCSPALAQALGVAVELGPESVGACIEQAGVGFMFAPHFHPAMKAVVPVRKALRVGAMPAVPACHPMVNQASRWCHD